MATPNGDGQQFQRALTPYETWVRSQGIPIVRGHGVTDLAEPEFGRWDRLGCDAYFILLEGMTGFTGMYVAQIDPGAATNQQRHLYEKTIYVLQGSGITTLEDPRGKTHQFEWQEGSLFAIPLNTPYRLFASGSRVRYVAVTTAPVIIDLFHNDEFIHNCPFSFTDRFNGEPDFWSKDVRYEGSGNTLLGQFSRRGWETNFVPDARSVLPDKVDPEKKSLRFIQYELTGNSLITHESKYPSGSYMRAHYHSGGAILLILRSEGYSMMWDKELGDRPFESGHGGDVVKIDWKPGSVFSPPTGWFHQHFNVGAEDALQLAFRYGSRRFPFGIWHAVGARDVDGEVGTMRMRGDGGAVIDYSQEDPHIRQLFNERLRQNGIHAWTGSPALSGR